MDKVNDEYFATIDDAVKEPMNRVIEDAFHSLDSVGGTIETAIINMPAGVGEPYFDSVESILSHALYSVGAVKGVQFGTGFPISRMYGSEANDSFRMKDGKVITSTNHNGGINGGITNGMPIIITTAIKPTLLFIKSRIPSISVNVPMRRSVSREDMILVSLTVRV